jgi:hypothetical protein
MSSVTIARTALLAVLLATFAVGSDKTPPTHQKGSNGEPIPRNKTVFELRGTDLVYLIDYCGAFQAGKFDLGQAVDDRVDKNDLRLYIRRDNSKEYKCKIEGKKMILEGAKTDAPSTSAPPAKP